MSSDAAADAYLLARRLTGGDASASGRGATYLRPETTQPVDEEVAAWLQARSSALVERVLGSSL